MGDGTVVACELCLEEMKAAFVPESTAPCPTVSARQSTARCHTRFQARNLLQVRKAYLSTASENLVRASLRYA